jgi:hypothetical protein
MTTSSNHNDSRSEERPRRADPRASQDDSLLLLRGKSRGRRISGLAVEVRPIVLGVLTMVLVTLAGWLYLEQATQVTDVAHAILTLDRQSQELRQEIVILRADSARLGALHRLVEQGERLQYALPDADDAARRLVIEAPSQAAVAQRAAPPWPGSAGAETPAQTPWERMKSWIEGLGKGVRAP